MLRITNVIGNMNRHTLSIWLTLLVWISWPCSWKGSSLNFKLENQTFIRLSTFDTNTLFLWIFCSMHAIRLVVLGWSFLEDCKVKKKKKMKENYFSSFEYLLDIVNIWDLHLRDWLPASRQLIHTGAFSSSSKVAILTWG